MPLKKISFLARPEDANKRLDQVLAARLGEFLPTSSSEISLSKGKVRMLIVAGAVYLNGKRVRIASKTLMNRARIDVYLDLTKLKGSTSGQNIPFEITKDRILFEDEDVIVINKPAGIPTQPTLDEARVNLFAAVKKYLAKKAGVALPQVYLAMHHRLDRDTSGAILFSKSLKANPGLAKAFLSREVEKVYQALTLCSGNHSTGSLATGSLGESEEWTVKNFLGVDPRSAKKRKRFCAVKSGGDPAHTDFKILEKWPLAFRIEARPHTGRTHQIRVHLSEIGLPILGDQLYGGPKNVGKTEIPRVMLHAARLTFNHPIHQNRIAIQCELPGDFEKCIRALSGETPRTQRQGDTRDF